MQTVPPQEVQIAAPFSLSSGAKANFLRRLCAALFNPVDISFLVFFRILFGGIMLWEVYRYFTYDWITRLRTKGGEAVFTVTHPGSGQTWTIKPEDYLKTHQAMKMTTKPDLILLFGHHLAEEKRREGYENVEVRARVMVSLNGRQPQLLIDPNLDLAKEQVSLSPARWIVPLTTPLGSR